MSTSLGLAVLEKLVSCGGIKKNTRNTTALGRAGVPF